MRAPRFAAVFAAVALCLTLAGCNASRLQAREGTAQSQKSCSSCKRMCEVAGDAQNNADGVAKCKADCDKKCG